MELEKKSSGPVLNDLMNQPHDQLSTDNIAKISDDHVLKFLDFDDSPIATQRPVKTEGNAMVKFAEALKNRTCEMVAHAAVGRPNDNQFPNIRAVVRDRKERQTLPQFQCLQCERFYQTFPQADKKGRECPHSKYFKQPPSTPKGFWDVKNSDWGDFDPTQNDM